MGSASFSVFLQPRYGYRAHHWLAWLALLAVLLFTLSGLTHPLMTWTGPKQTAFFPPQVKIQTNHIAAVPEILQQHKITMAEIIKIVPAASTAVLQVTELNNPIRRYFDLASLDELANYDQTHAITLARYYTGLADTPVSAVTLQTKFDHGYPWVNRLLPVYKIEFATHDKLTVYIDTELGALGNISNRWKTQLQTLFQLFHTGSWLNETETARVLILSILVLSLIGMSISGVMIILLFKKRPNAQSANRWHRRLATLACLPLFALSVSGCYHLLHNAYEPNPTPQRHNASLQWIPESLTKQLAGFEQYKNMTFNSLNLVQTHNKQLLYRLGVPKGKPQQMIEHDHRFDGMVVELPALYFDANTGSKIDFSDQDLVLQIAQQHLQRPSASIIHSERITHFGPYYDFRNKRLPVWRLDYATPFHEMIYIDPATGVLVDRMSTTDQLEALSFSFLHKWNFLTPLLGRIGRDLLVVLTLIVILGLAGFGTKLLIRSKI